MKSSDEIKKAMLHCSPVSCRSNDCPYKDDTPKYEGDMPVCRMKLWHDMVCLIQQLEAYKKRAMENAVILSAAVRRLEAERDAAIHDMHEAQGIVCLICKNHYQPDPAVKKYGCKEFGEHYPEEGSLACGMFEWRGVQKEDDNA